MVTLVVDVIVNGAVPVATVDVNVDPLSVVPIIEPLTCNLSVVLSVFVPIITLPENLANFIRPVSSTSILGIPEISFTENMVPVKLSVMLNNCPESPDIDKVSVSSILSEMVLVLSRVTKSIFWVCRPFLTANFLELAI